MKVRKFTQSNGFYDAVQDYLLAHEAEDCLPFAIAETLVKYPHVDSEQPYLAVLESAGKVVAVAIRTPPYKVVLSKISDFDAIEGSAEDLSSQQIKVPGFSCLTAETSTCS